MKVAEMNFNISSITNTGKLRHNTAFHSTQFSGVIWNNAVKNGTYKIMKWRPMLRAMAATRNGFFHTGKTNKLSFSDNEFMALNISTVTKIDRLIVVARCAIMFVNISQPI